MIQVDTREQCVTNLTIFKLTRKVIDYLGERVRFCCICIKFHEENGFKLV